jgi:hypothetical protein
MRSTGQARKFWLHVGIVTVVGVLVAVALAAAFMSIGHSPQPREVPVAVIGPAAAAQKLEAESDGRLAVQAMPNRAAAKVAIEERDVYAAVVPGRKGVKELVISSAASNQVASFMRRTLGRASEANVPRIVDAKPLPKDDSSNGSIGLLVQILMITGSLGVVGMARLLPRFRGDPSHGVLPVTFLLGYGLLVGFAIAGIAMAFGVGADAAFLDLVLAFTLISVAVTMSAGGAVALLGPAGAGLAAVVYFVLGSQISGAGTAPEFLPAFWSDLGQALPAGAATSLLRDVFYFPQASVGEPVAILAAYTTVGLSVMGAMTLRQLRRSRDEVPHPRAAASTA